LPRRRVVLTSRCDDYLLVLYQQLFQQRRQPIRFLDPRIDFAILLGEIVRLPLSRSHTHRTNELYFGPRQPTLRSRGRRRKFTICVVADLQHVPLSQGVSQCPVAKSRRGVGAVDTLNQPSQFLRRSFQLGLQFDRILLGLIAFLNARVLDQPLLQLLQPLLQVCPQRQRFRHFHLVISFLPQSV